MLYTHDKDIYAGWRFRTGRPSATGKEDSHVGHDHAEHHHDDDGHDHSYVEGSRVKLFAPAIVSFLLLMIAIVWDNWIAQEWFDGWIRVVWYVVAYVPVGFPVIKDAVVSIRKGDVFFGIFVNGYRYHWRICYR
ncbi:hypothetical protein OKW96_10355 [Sphingobacterium sp. KU25419]|nr:hypothetical protein OKW96_10355 [Sphingobacterium sp. KU25419]